MPNCFELRRNASAFLLLIGMLGSMPETASAQLYFGGGLVYGGTLGIQTNGNLVVDEANKLRIGADLTFYFKEKTTVLDTRTKVSLFAINVNGHYMFVTAQEFILYAIGGLNLSFRTFDESAISDDTEIGLNAGGGFEFEVPFGRVYGELKYILGVDQLVIGAGVRLPILGGNN